MRTGWERHSGHKSSCVTNTTISGPLLMRADKCFLFDVFLSGHYPAPHTTGGDSLCFLWWGQMHLCPSTSFCFFTRCYFSSTSASWLEWCFPFLSGRFLWGDLSNSTPAPSCRRAQVLFQGKWGCSPCTDKRGQTVSDIKIFCLVCQQSS